RERARRAQGRGEPGRHAGAGAAAGERSDRREPTARGGDERALCEAPRMSVRATVRAFPTLLRIGFADAVAYRAEMIVWILATTMPLVMLALWSAVAQNQPIGRYGQPQFVAYFLCTFIVRQMASSWAFYEMNFEVRNGTLAMRLL